MKRARLLLRVRTVERSAAMAQAASAEGAQKTLAGVADRTRELGAHYGACLPLARTAGDFAHRKAMTQQIARLGGLAEAQASSAAEQADAARLALAQAERRCDRAAKDCRRLAHDRQRLADLRE